MSNKSILAGLFGRKVQAAVCLVASLCVLSLLGGCRHEVVMLNPVNDKLTNYYVKDVTVDVDSVKPSKRLPETGTFFSAIENVVAGALRHSLQGKNPADVIVRFAKILDHESYSWTGKDGLVSHHTISELQFNVKLTIRDHQTRDVVAEQWFNLGHGRELPTYMEKLAERIGLWIGSSSQTSPDSASSALTGEAVR